MKSKNDVILAGVARSGSTLACYLLNKTPDAIALLEPIEPKEVITLSDDKVITFLNHFFTEQRESIKINRFAKSKSTKGQVPDNLMGDVDKKTGKRKNILDGKSIEIKKKLNNNFSLIIKQPGMFTGMLGLLKHHFPCYATIRNPLSVLQSWNTVDMAVTNGHAPAAEECDPSLKELLANESDVYNRQILLLSWYFEQFHNHLANENIIRYEEVINSGGKNLACITSSARQLEENLVSKNKNSLYDPELKKELAKRLLASNGYFWCYYDKEDVLQLL